MRHLVAGNFANKQRLQRVAKDVAVPFPIRIAKGKKDCSPRLAKEQFARLSGLVVPDQNLLKLSAA